ncbi:sugar ABC transporter permease [Actinotalea sp. M2MS4P-6]|uniref:multiple monosaccharide ABC transporter permease n=1 Tax=Actinotalea sp. M2MS4P-6 TaxID=2983762 RepID=UPI0021E4990D|nr:multiple monosaccharide ABC transporter permease [Actinotalea sp. M2MS4P-6]MCV2395767.1 sugar ABC transporter permease [Actinotalea sp. M2MS4P-6]
MKSLKELFGGGARQFGMVFALLALVLIFQISTGGKVLTPTNVQNIINGNSYVLILAIGMVLVIIAGHIDLSVGSVAAVVGIIVALAIRDWGIPWWLGVLLGLAVGAVIGAWQGFWVAYVGIPGFITTLAGMMFFRGANQYIGKSNTIPVPKEIQYLGAGYLPEWGPNTGLNNSTLVLGIAAIAAVVWVETRRRRSAVRLGAEPAPVWVSAVRVVALGAVIAYLTFLFGGGRVGTSFPFSGVILAALVLIYGFLSTRTVTGRHVYAVGGNKVAASLSGVNIRRTNFFVMMNMSVLAALAGIVFIGRSTASGPFDGTNWELDAIAAVFIGGAAVSGGVGTVAGSVIGGLVMAVLNNGLQLMGVGSDLTQMIKGLVLLAAVAFDVYNKGGRTSIFSRLFKSRGGDGTANLTPAVAGTTSMQG